MSDPSKPKFPGSDNEEYLEYCNDMEMNPEDEDSWEMWKEVQAELGDSAWGSMDEDDREGWNDNMNKD